MAIIIADLLRPKVRMRLIPSQHMYFIVNLKKKRNPSMITSMLDMRERHPTTCANQPSERKLSLDRPSATLFVSTDSWKASNTILIFKKVFTVNSFVSDSGNVQNINQTFYKYFSCIISKKSNCKFISQIFVTFLSLQ